MIEPKRIESNIKPNKFFNLGTGYWYYNYDIQKRQTTVQGTDEETPHEESVYSYIQVRIAGRPDYKKCVESIIREHITSSQEFDLINSYNRYSLGLENSDSIKTDYMEYLKKLQEIKTNIKKDFNSGDF